MDGTAPQAGHVSRARLHSFGAAAARVHRSSPDVAAADAELAASWSYDELLDARCVKHMSGTMDYYNYLILLAV